MYIDMNTVLCVVACIIAAIGLRYLIPEIFRVMLTEGQDYEPDRRAESYANENGEPVVGKYRWINREKI